MIKQLTYNINNLRVIVAKQNNYNNARNKLIDQKIEKFNKFIDS